MSNSRRSERDREFEQIISKMPFADSGDELCRGVVGQRLSEMQSGDVCYTHPNSIPTEMLGGTSGSIQPISRSAVRVGYNPTYGAGWDRIFGS